jgi:hypothetical protein
LIRFDSVTGYIEALVRFDRSIELFVVFAGWSFEWRSSGSGDGRLVLATVVWFWSQSSGYRSGASLSREDVRKEGRVKVAFRCIRGMQRHV